MISETYNQDCLEAMRGMPDNAFDLAIVDPPYGIAESGASNHSRGKLAISKKYKPFAGKDMESPCKDYFGQLFRVSKNQIICGANHFISKIDNPDSSCWVVWDKENGETDFADCELLWTSFSTAVRRLRYRWHGMLQQNMRFKEFRIHPTQKPIELYKWLLLNYAKSGDTILDTHLGSQSSRIAAWDLGFDFVGYEVDKYYFDAGNNRFAEHIVQPRLFLLENQRHEIQQELSF